MKNRNLFSVPTSDIKEKLKLMDKLNLASNKGVPLLHPDWGLNAVPGDLVIVAGATGHFKSTFMLNCIYQAIIRDKKCIYFMNEENEASALSRLVQQIIHTKKKKNREDALNFILERVKIADAYETTDVLFYDKVAGLVESSVIEYKPDIIFFDQISYCSNSSEGNSDLPIFEKLPYITEQLKRLINSGQDFPPVVITQQGYAKIKTEDPLSVMRGASNTGLAATKIIHLLREHNSMEVSLVKHRGSFPPSEKAYFYLEPDSGLFVPEKSN